MMCRFCRNELNIEFIDLLNAPASNSFMTKEQLNEPEVYYPLKIFVCDKCFLVQIDEYKKSGDIFNNNYAYFSSYSSSWLKHSMRYVGMIINRLMLGNQSYVIEIACNDGYLLQYFVERGVPCLGIEPSSNTAKIAKEKGIPVLVNFFGEKLAKTLEKADLILGNNVLAHVPDINDFVKGLKIALKPAGTITMEFPHLLNLIKYNQFDTIYHEHFSYLSLLTVQEIFKAHGLKLYDVEELPTHGGSLRIYATHDINNNIAVNKSVADLIEREEQFGLKSIDTYTNFTEKVQKIKADFWEFILQKRKEGNTISAYGAAAKGNTLLNYCGVKNDYIDFVVDAAPSKQGKFLPGSHIPVVKEDVLREIKPDYVIIFPWNIKDEITSQLAYIREWNSKFVTFVPQLEIF